jgi:hypothetical protein
MTRTRTKRTETRPIDLDPLTAIRRELVSAARRKLLARRRRRRALAAGAAAFGALALSAAALAVTESGTGVGAIDRFLDTASEKPRLIESHPLSDGHDGDAGPELAPPPQPDFRAAAGSASDPFRVRLGEDRQTSAVGYTSQDGDICSALTDPSPRPEAPNGFAACAGAAFLQRMLERQAVVTVAEGHPNSSVGVVQGYANADVRSIGVLNALSGVQVSLSDSWMPAGWRGQPLRVFFVTQPASDRGAALGLTELELQARMADGRTIDFPAGS